MPCTPRSSQTGCIPAKQTEGNCVVATTRHAPGSPPEPECSLWPCTCHRPETRRSPPTTAYRSEVGDQPVGKGHVREREDVRSRRVAFRARVPEHGMFGAAICQANLMDRARRCPPPGATRSGDGLALGQARTGSGPPQTPSQNIDGSEGRLIGRAGDLFQYREVRDLARGDAPQPVLRPRDWAR
jgi:hypothetical protein